MVCGGWVIYVQGILILIGFELGTIFVYMFWLNITSTLANKSNYIIHI